VSFKIRIYGQETWSLTLREEHRLRVFENRVFENRVFENRVFENRVLRRIFGPKRDRT
jgi:hypothetical protein